MKSRESNQLSDCFYPATKSRTTQVLMTIQTKKRGSGKHRKWNLLLWHLHVWLLIKLWEL